jgi:hypothetical protein
MSSDAYLDLLAQTFRRLASFLWLESRYDTEAGADPDTIWTAWTPDIVPGHLPHWHRVRWLQAWQVAELEEYDIHHRPLRFEEFRQLCENHRHVRLDRAERLQAEAGGQQPAVGRYA